MATLALGVSYRRAPVELLERLSFSGEDYPKAYGRLLDSDAVREAVILSTCNRVEVYAEVTSYHAAFLALKTFLAEAREVAPDEFADPLYSHYEDHAAEHLFLVAAGADSMVLGEPQILTQVRQAYRRAEVERATGPVLSALFRQAIRTGRRARAETSIGASPAALVEAGTRLAERALGGLAGRSVLVVGAGGMASIAATFLRGKGVGHIRVLNRSPERARSLASRTGGDHGGLELLSTAMGRADLVVSSTGAAGLVIRETTVREALARRIADGRPLFLLDLAVPRDVDPSVARLDGVQVADIDDLRDSVADGRGTDAVERVRRIVGEEVARFAAWRRAWRLAPLIHALREKGDRIRAGELARAAPKLGDLSDRQREAVEALARGVVAKLLHDPIARVKEQPGPGGADQMARAVADLFGLDVRPGT